MQQANHSSGLPKKHLTCFLQIFRIVLVIAAAFGFAVLGAQAANAFSDAWKRDFQNAYDEQFDMGLQLDLARSRAREANEEYLRLSSEYERYRRFDGLDRENLAKAKRKIAQAEEDLRIFDRNPNRAPENAESYVKWHRGQAIRRMLDYGQRDPEIVAAEEETRLIERKREIALEVRANAIAAQDNRDSEQSRIPGLVEAHKAALRRYRGFTSQIIPQDDSDLRALSQRANAIGAAAPQCQGGKCSPEQRKLAHVRLQSLADSEAVLTSLLDHLKNHRRNATAHRNAVYEQLENTLDRKDLLEKLLVAQEAAVGVASDLLDLTSIVDGIRNIDDLFDPQLYKHERIDSALEFLKDFESLTTSIMSNADLIRDANGPLADLQSWASEKVGHDGTPIGPTILDIAPNPADLATLKSHGSDLHSLILDFRRLSEGGPVPGTEGWSDFLKSDRVAGMRASVGQLIGRIAKDYAAAEIAERKQRLDDLIIIISAEAAASESVVEMLLRTAERRAAARQALEAIQHAQDAQAQCTNGCDYPPIEAADLRTLPSIPQELDQYNGISLSSGSALRSLNSRLHALLDSDPQAKELRDQGDVVPSSDGARPSQYDPF